MTVSLSQYFEYLDGRGFIREYLSTVSAHLRNGGQREERILSLELNIPAVWQEVMLPEEAGILQRRVESPAGGSLPAAIQTRLTKLGFISERVGVRVYGGPRRYILRPHTFPISRNFYRYSILPNIRGGMLANPIPLNAMFSRAMTSAPVINAQINHYLREEEMDRYLNNEPFQSPQEATDFLNNLFRDF